MVSAQSKTSYAGMQFLCACLVVLVVAISALAPLTHTTTGGYQTLVGATVITYSPVLLTVNRTWFRVISAIVLAVWTYLLLGSLAWGSVSIHFLILPIPLIITWFLPPAPADRRSFLTIAGSGGLVALLVVATSLLIAANEGDVVYVCSNEPVESFQLELLGEPHPGGGYSLPEGVISSSASPGGHAFRFGPFTDDERDALVEGASQAAWVTAVHINQPCVP